MKGLLIQDLEYAPSCASGVFSAERVVGNHDLSWATMYALVCGGIYS